MGYVLPVGDVRKSTYIAHTRRQPPSQEAGVDYYCAIGTPIHCADNGVVVDIGRSIAPATGYFVTVDLDDGRRVRYLHLSSIPVSVGQRVKRGQVIALSGATGYGEADWSWNVAETGGAHVHVTLWPRQSYRFGVNSGTLDFHSYAEIAAIVAGNESEEDMPLNEADKDWVRSAVRQEIGGALAGFADDYARMVAGEPLSEDNKTWIRDQTRQEIGGAIAGYTDSIAAAVVAKLDGK